MSDKQITNPLDEQRKKALNERLKRSGVAPSNHDYQNNKISIIVDSCSDSNSSDSGDSCSSGD